MQLGTFSVSLAVKDLATSRAFYEKLGFEVFHDQTEANYLIMKNGTATVGLFMGMFEGNILTFNPGWDDKAQDVDPFDDVRAIQKQLKNNEVGLVSEVDEASTGPASLMLQDPDGNMILVDQHR